VGDAHYIQIASNYAYIANSDIFTGGLRILDLSTGTAPTLLGKVETVSRAIALHVVDHRAYMVSKEVGLQIVDVAVPAAPGLLGRYGVVGKVDVLRQAGSRMFLSGGDDSLNGLSIVDPTGSVQPSLIGKIGSPTTHGFTALQIEGNFVYGIDAEATPNNEVSIIDISQPLTPTLRGVYPRSGYDLAMTGNTAYLAKSGGLDILDMGDPVHPLLKTTYPMTTTYLVQYPFDARQIEVVGARAYVADQYKEFQILDMATPAVPKRLGTYDVAYAEALRYIAVEGQFVYGAYERFIDPDHMLRGVQVVDVTNPFSPTLRGQYDGLQGFVEDLEVVGSRLYITAYNLTSSSITILDISDPNAPRPIAGCLFPRYLGDIVVEGNLIYVASEDSGVQVFQVVDLPYAVWLPIAQNQGF
jgi:hypothetical protein